MQLGNLYVSTFGTDSSLNVEVDNLLTTYYMGSYDITKIMKDVRMQIQSMSCFKYDTLEFYLEEHFY